MASEGEAVLVVDDDVELLGMVEILLDEAGYRVIMATEGQEALEKVEQEMPAVIISSPWSGARPSMRPRCSVSQSSSGGGPAHAP